VIITGRDVERGKKAVEDIHEAGSVRFVAADLADLDSVAELVREAGSVDIIVNGAGAFPVAPTIEQEVSSFERIFDTNVRGAYFLVAQLVPHMLEQGRGSIINITSIAAWKGIPGASVYSASKAALTSLTRTWAAEFGSSGVRVNAVSPGPTRTDGVLLEWGESIEDIAKTLPLGRTARAHEIAEAVLFLASPRTSYMTGSTIHVDAGSTAI
jgi:NAD(P)-dependent dehydrogenase (short-subunit alcohol dehydrogenase family)